MSSWHARRGVFEPFVLVVPNRNVEAYVKVALARAHGVAANLDVVPLRRFVERLARPARLVDGDALLGHVLARLLDEDALARPDLARVRAYLRAAGDADDAVERRRVGLARHLARLFEEYAYGRRDLLEAWREGRGVPLPAPFADAEPWQRALWRAVLGPEGAVARRGLVTILDLPGRPLAAPPEAHLFGFSYVARAYHDVLAHAARSSALHVYALNPCREYWEDVDEDDPVPLRAWGRPGRDHLRTLQELAECDFEDAFVDPGEAPPSLLAAIQRDVLVRASADSGPREADGSVRVLACPSVRREAEAVAAEVWDFVRASPDARLDEVCVLVPARGADAYVPHLEAAFHEAHDLPFHVVDVPLARTSRVAEAIELLVDLAGGSFTRHEVMRVLLHPAVVARFPELGHESVAALPEALGIVHGADHDDHRGTYIARDVLNWDQGLRRLALGAVMAGEKSGARGPLVLGDDAYAPLEQVAGARDAAATFGAVARSLLADARFARTARLTTGAWAAFFRALATTYVAPDGPREEEAHFACLAALAELEAIDTEGAEVPWRVAAELARAKLAGLAGRRGSPLAQGVLVSTFVPMRAIPFRMIAVMGLDEGRFPAPDPRDPLDLRLAERRRGDVGPRDQDRYAFLETLLCARERVVVSYVARDALTGEARAPSSVVHDLAAAARAPLAREVPLRRWAAAEVDRFGAPPEAAREARAVALREDLGRHLAASGAAGARPTLADVRAAATPDVRAGLEACLGLAAIPTTPARPGALARVSVSLSALRRFLECPMQGHAQHRLGLVADDEDDPLEAEDEVLETSPLSRAIVLRAALLDARATGATLDAAYDAARARLEQVGGAPTGLFGDAERAAHRALLRKWDAQVERSVGAARLVQVRIGRADEHAEVAVLVDAVELDAGGARVTIHGGTQPLAEDPAASFTFLARRKFSSEAATRIRRRALPAWLDHLALAAAGVSSGVARPVHVCFASRTASDRVTVRLPPIAPEEARAQLGALVADLLGGPHDYLLPIEAALRALDAPDKPVRTHVADLLEIQETRADFEIASMRGPVAEADTYPVPAEDVARAMIARRFGAFARATIEEDP